MRPAARRLLLAAIALAAMAASAQTGGNTPAPPPDQKAETPSRETPESADRDFQPTEEISPDQEVDFPADL